MVGLTLFLAVAKSLIYIQNNNGRIIELNGTSIWAFPGELTNLDTIIINNNNNLYF